MTLILYARILVANSQYNEALSLLDKLFPMLEKFGLKIKITEARILKALIYFKQGNEDHALIKIREALDLALHGMFVCVFIDEGPPMARLLYEALSRGIAPDYVRRLLAAFPDTEPEQTDPTEFSAPKCEWIEPLSDREIEVLKLVAAGLTNKEIATRLYLSLNTIKVHTRNINGKLGVKNRMQAAARARALGILPNN